MGFLARFNAGHLLSEKEFEFNTMSENRFHLYLFDLYQRYSPELIAFSYQYVYNKEDAHDIVHGLFEKILQKENSLKIPLENARAYLYKGVRNHCLNLISRKETERKFVKEYHSGSEFRMEDQIVDQAVLDDLFKHVTDHFSETERSIFILRFLENMKLDEIALIVESSAPTVSRIVQKISEELKTKFF